MLETGDSTPYSPIQCQLYDYIEVSCLRHYELEIELIAGDHTMDKRITGKAKTTMIRDKQEFLILELEASQDHESKEIRLDFIKSIKPLDEKAEFGLLTIT